MDYSQYVLSSSSERIPEIGECDKCPFVNKCDSGEKCLVMRGKVRYRNHKEYYRKNRERILAYQQLAKALKKV
jgi:hypothetical protein